MHRRRKVDAGAGLQLKAPGQRDGGDRAGGGKKMGRRQSEPCGNFAPYRTAERQAAEEHRGVQGKPAPAHPIRQRDLRGNAQGGKRRNP
jgi:hypothetical protein